MKKHSLFLLVILFSSLSFSQDFEEDEVCTMPDKKVMKIIKAAENPKIGFKEKSLLYYEAIELDDEKAFSYFTYAEYLYFRAMEQFELYKDGRADLLAVRKQFTGAAKQYRNAMDLCPELHSSMHYKLGFIYFYVLGDKESGKDYFNSFLSYQHEDPDRYPEEYMQWKNDVVAMLSQLEKTENYSKNFYEKPVPFDPVMVRNVSTAKDEYLPIISPDNELIFYTRKGDERALGDMQSQVKEVFTVSQRPDIFSDFNSGTPLMSPFNTNEYGNYGGVSISVDNKEMFICACKFEQIQGQKYNNCDIYVTKYKRNGNKNGYDYIWTPLENLGKNINTNTGWEAQPTLSADGNTLYFSVVRKGTRGIDIYYSTRGKDGVWSLAKPIPGPINSDGHDKSPYLHQDSETMYFVSQVSEKRTGAGEPGNFDIFYSRKDESGNWSEPKNIGYPINSDEDEVGLIVSTDGKLAYIATNNRDDSQGFDLYNFELYEAAQPKKVVFVKGEIKDESGDPVQDAIVEISYNNQGESVEVAINGDDGKFAAVVNVDKPQDVVVAVKKKGYSFDTKVISKLEIEEMKSKDKTFVPEKMQMEIGKLEIGKSFTIDNILFATDSYDLNSRSKLVLDQFIKFLEDNPSVTVIIEGHTDDKGDNSKNLILSKNRANAAKGYLIENGIADNRLKSVGYGESQPKVDNSSEANRAKNRRTDFKLTGV